MSDKDESPVSKAGPGLIRARVVLAFDQAPRHSGWAIIDSKTGDVIEGGSEVFSDQGTANDLAEDYCKRVLNRARILYAIEFVVFEDAYLHPAPGMWKYLNQLAELRGRCIAYARETGLPYTSVAPAQWQTWIGIKPGTKGEFIKKTSMQLAKLVLRKGIDASWLTEDAADACHIGRKAWSDRLQNSLLRGVY